MFSQIFAVSERRNLAVCKKVPEILFKSDSKRENKRLLTEFKGRVQLGNYKYIP